MALAAALLGVSAVRADGDPAEARMRDQLRQTTLELRQAQDENAALKAKLQVLAVQASAPPPPPTRPTVDQSAGLRQQLRAQATQLEDLRKQLEDAHANRAQWQDAYQKAVAVAQERDAAARQSDGQSHELDARLQTCNHDNAELTQIGQQLLQRYHDKGVWEAFGEKEPLTQLQRVHMEQLVQDYQIKLKDLKTTPAEPPANQGAR